MIATAPKRIVGLAVSSRAVVYAYNLFKRTRTGFRDVGNVVAIPTG